jgi:hypothetical protein
MKRHIKPQEPTPTDDKPTIEELLRKMRELEDDQLKDVQGGCTPGEVCGARCMRCRLS